MGLQILNQAVALNSMSSLSDFVFGTSDNDTIDCFFYGLTGFNLVFPDGKGHNILDVGVSLSANKNGRTISITPNVVMTDDGANQPSDSESWIQVTVVAWVNSNNGDIQLGNTGLINSGTQASPFTLNGASTVQLTQQIFSGFQLAYTSSGWIGDDNQIQKITGSVTNPGNGSITPNSFMTDNSQHTASAQADGALLASYDSSPSFVVKTMLSQQSTGTVACDCGVTIDPSNFCVLMSAFRVQYESNNAHDVHQFAVGVCGNSDSLVPFVDSSSPTKVQIPAPQCILSDGSGHTQDNTTTKSSVDLVIIACQSPTDS